MIGTIELLYRVEINGYQAISLPILFNVRCTLARPSNRLVKTAFLFLLAFVSWPATVAQTLASECKQLARQGFVYTMFNLLQTELLPLASMKDLWWILSIAFVRKISLCESVWDPILIGESSKHLLSLLCVLLDALNGTYCYYLLLQLSTQTRSSTK